MSLSLYSLVFSLACAAEPDASAFLDWHVGPGNVKTIETDIALPVVDDTLRLNWRGPAVDMLFVVEVHPGGAWVSVATPPNASSAILLVHRDAKATEVLAALSDGARRDGTFDIAVTTDRAFAPCPPSPFEGTDEKVAELRVLLQAGDLSAVEARWEAATSTCATAREASEMVVNGAGAAAIGAQLKDALADPLCRLDGAELMALHTVTQRRGWGATPLAFVRFYRPTGPLDVAEGALWGDVLPEWLRTGGTERLAIPTLQKPAP